MAGVFQNIDPISLTLLTARRVCVYLPPPLVRGRTHSLGGEGWWVSSVLCICKYVLCAGRLFSHHVIRSGRPGHHHPGLRGLHAVAEVRVGARQPRRHHLQEDVDHPRAGHLCAHRYRNPGTLSVQIYSKLLGNKCYSI
jgi:hypothetical protein